MRTAAQDFRQWRTLAAIQRQEVYAHLDRAIAQYDDPDGGLYMPDIADNYRAAIAVLERAERMLDVRVKRNGPR